MYNMADFQRLRIFDDTVQQHIKEELYLQRPPLFVVVAWMQTWTNQPQHWQINSMKNIILTISTFIELIVLCRTVPRVVRSRKDSTKSHIMPEKFIRKYICHLGLILTIYNAFYRSYNDKWKHPNPFKAQIKTIKLVMGAILKNSLV